MSHTLKVLTSAKTDEQYTPDNVIVAVLEALQVIDLDPCSNSHEFPNIPARYRYTQADDGLSKPWCCPDGTPARVYMNHPYSDSRWITYLISEYQSGRVCEAIALTKSATDTRWYQEMAQFPLCFWNGRLKFKNPDNKSGAAPFGSTLFYLGQNPARFARVFARYGRIYYPANYRIS
ncbi:MAG TPA: DNA N-6-adenine-methyltransferase [Candidatus Obscuribacterales bacterium]